MVLDVQPCVYPNTAPPPPPPQGHNKTGCQSVATSSCKLLKSPVPDAQFSPVLDEHDGVRWSSVASNSGLPYQFKGLLSEVFCHCCGWVTHFTNPYVPRSALHNVFSFSSSLPQRSCELHFCLFPLGHTVLSAPSWHHLSSFFLCLCARHYVSARLCIWLSIQFL